MRKYMHSYGRNFVIEVTKETDKTVTYTMSGWKSPSRQLKTSVKIFDTFEQLKAWLIETAIYRIKQAGEAVLREEKRLIDAENLTEGSVKP